MASSITRNSFKGYSYQQYAYAFFVCKMDTEREIHSIDAEMLEVEHKFEDLQLVTDENAVYHVQVKNYPNTTFEEIKIGSGTIKIASKTSRLSEEGINLVFISSVHDFPCNSTIFGLDAYHYEGTSVYVVRMTSDMMASTIANMFRDESRIVKIRALTDKKTTSDNFYTQLTDLPPLETFSTKLEQETLVVRKFTEQVGNGILQIEGTPGIGKSHLVDIITRDFLDAVVYRFWIGSQDVNSTNRRQYRHFLSDLALKVIGSPRSFTEEELAESINNSSRLIIIDGLDHVENYNRGELENYVGFIEKIQKSKVIVLTRPLKRSTGWKKHTLVRWSEEETRSYLSNAGISDYSVGTSFHLKTRGYPIILYFFKEYYLKHEQLPTEQIINTVEDYYSVILTTLDTSTALSVFLLVNGFLTKEDILEFLDDFTVKMVLDYINIHSYLFTTRYNRISLFHDSFNTFLRNSDNFAVADSWVTAVKSSILTGEIRYLSRIASLHIADDNFWEDVLRKYADIDFFYSLIVRHSDFESIKELYNGLKSILEYREGVLDIYEYYSFILICTIVERNNLVGSETILYYHLKSLIDTGLTEANIFSSGRFWGMYHFVSSEDGTIYEETFRDDHYDESVPKEIYELVEREGGYFSILTSEAGLERAYAYLASSKYHTDTREVLEDILIYSYINKLDEHGFFSAIDNYLNEKVVEGSEATIKGFASLYLLNPYESRFLLPKVRNRLWSLGYVRENNPYLNAQIISLYESYATKGADDLQGILENYLRLSFYEKRSVDTSHLPIFYYMYQYHKDMSVIAINNGLATFERKKLVSVNYSLTVLKSVMLQSYKGIRHLLQEYLDKKDVSFLSSHIDHLLADTDYKFDIFDLSLEKINVLDDKVVVDRLVEIMSSPYSYRQKEVRFEDVSNLLKSEKKHLAVWFIKHHEYAITNISDPDFLYLSDDEVLFKDESSHEKEYVPLEYGTISVRDKKYVTEAGISALELARYHDGWNHSFAVLEVFEHFSKEELNRDLLEIVHTSLFTRSRYDFVGNWFYFLGNIPAFLDRIEYDTDWDRMFSIFEKFLELSLIPYPSSSVDV